MSELKAFEVTGKALFGRVYTKKVYLKSEADKVFADLKESHKMEVEQLLIEIVDLEKRIADGDKDFEMAFHQNERLLKIVRHHKYKRCLAMANYWVAISYHCVDDKHRQKAEKRHYKWLELAEKFKEGV